MVAAQQCHQISLFGSSATPRPRGPGGVRDSHNNRYARYQSAYFVLKFECEVLSSKSRKQSKPSTKRNKEFEKFRKH